MQKKFLIVCFLVFIGMVKHADSQVIIGLLFGDKLNKGPIEFGLNIVGNHSVTSIENGSSYRQKLGFGLYLDYKFNPNLILSGSFFFASPKGEKDFNEKDPLYFLTDSLFTGANTERALSYFEFPLMFEYRAYKRIGIGFGGYISYLNRAKDTYKRSTDNGDIYYERSILSKMNRFDYGMKVGVHYHFQGDPGSIIKFNYQQGFADLLKDGSTGQGQNTTWQIGVMIPIKFGVLPSDPIEE